MSDHGVGVLLGFDVSVNPAEKILTPNTFTEEFCDDLKHHNWVLDIKDKHVDAGRVTEWIGQVGIRLDQVIIFVVTNNDLVTRVDYTRAGVLCCASDHEKDWGEVRALGAQGLIGDEPTKAVKFVRAGVGYGRG